MDFLTGLLNNAGPILYGCLAGCTFLSIFYIICGWKLYEKANQPGWASIVPFYRIIVYLKIIGKPLSWYILFLIPIVNVVYGIKAVNLLSKSFGKDQLWTLGLLFFGMVFYPLMAFNNDIKYVGPAGIKQG